MVMSEAHSDNACRPPQPVLQKKVAHENRYGKTSKCYQEKVYKWKHHFLGVMQELQSAFPPEKLPIDFSSISLYLSGFNVHLESFNPNKHGYDFEGVSYVEGKDVYIFYSILVPPERQRFTVAHEFAHVLQKLDSEFLEDMEAIEDADDRAKILEAVADYIAAFYLAPLSITEDLLIGKCFAGTPEQRAECIARELWVSKQMAKITISNYRTIAAQTHSC
jgi:hypothetical protein